MKTNFKISIEYDGTLFSGWQVQNRCSKTPSKNIPCRTIQGELEKVLSMIFNQEIKINGSGRTDTGVHALGQVASFKADTTMECTAIKNSINSILKGSIVIHECIKAEDHFHARYDALSKEYHYHILNRPDPCSIGRDYTWHIKQPLNLQSMEECCKIIMGTHDFKAFEGAGSPRSSTVRTIYSAEFDRDGQKYGNRNDRDRLIFKIKGNGFLRFMVRNIVGTLVLAGIGKLSPEKFKTILQAKDRSLAGATAPAKGLFLIRVFY